MIFAEHTGFGFHYSWVGGSIDLGFIALTFIPLLVGVKIIRRLQRSRDAYKAAYEDQILAAQEHANAAEVFRNELRMVTAERAQIAVSRDRIAVRANELAEQLAEAKKHAEQVGREMEADHAESDKIREAAVATLRREKNDEIDTLQLHITMLRDEVEEVEGWIKNSDNRGQTIERLKQEIAEWKRLYEGVYNRVKAALISC